MKKLFSQNPFIYLVQKLWQYSEGNRSKVVMYVSYFTIANTIISLEPLIIGYFLNYLQKYGVTKENLAFTFFLLFLFLLEELIFWCFHGPARVTESKNAFLVRNNYKEYLLKGVMDLPIEWQADHHSGDTIDKIEKGTEALFNFTGRTFEILSAVILLIIAFAALSYYDFIAAAIAVLITILTLFLLILFDRKLVPGYRIVNRLENAVSAKMFDVLSNITTVIILRIESLLGLSLRKDMQKPFTQYMENARTNEWKWFTASVLGRLPTLIVIGAYLIQSIGKGTILIGTIYILYGYTNQLRGTFFSFAGIYNDIIRYRTSVANAEELSDDFKEMGEVSHKHLPEGWQTLSIKNLSFSYDATSGRDLHLDNLEMQIRRGERIAVIGQSGGGKSTFLKLVRDLYHPKSLELSVDGKKIQGGFKTVSDSISLVPQDPEIFTTTIRENITLGIEYSDEEIRRFTDMACFSDVLNKLPSGLESSIVEKGVNLSGGERQRLALSRGLMASADKDVVLLDEPTSSVDFANELKIYEHIFDSFKGKTIISSIHRLHLLSLFDTIYFFKAGKIIASGSLDLLKENSPDFQDLWERYLKSQESGQE